MSLTRWLADEAGWLFALVVIAALYVGKELVDAVVRFQRERRARQRFIAALYAEIEYNTHDLEEFLDEASPPEAMKAELAKKEGPKSIHITDAHHVAIYQQGLAQLSLLPQAAIYEVVAFYNHLDKINAQSVAMGSASFREASDAGRNRSIDLLWANIEDAAALGRDAMALFRADRNLRRALRARRGPTLTRRQARAGARHGD